MSWKTFSTRVICPRCHRKIKIPLPLFKSRIDVVTHHQFKCRHCNAKLLLSDKNFLKKTTLELQIRIIIAAIILLTFILIDFTFSNILMFAFIVIVGIIYVLISDFNTNLCPIATLDPSEETEQNDLIGSA
ncbi:MAG: hypothetical protein PHV17_09880 [Candidatus Omnitrophica bacterium]|nr:hypothetical protein [Candidatus Omnitrophota bacterium]